MCGCVLQCYQCINVSPSSRTTESVKATVCVRTTLAERKYVKMLLCCELDPFLDSLKGRQVLAE